MPSVVQIITFISNPFGFLVSLGVIITGVTYAFGSRNKALIDKAQGLISIQQTTITELSRQIDEGKKEMEEMRATIKEQATLIQDLNAKVESMTGYTELHTFIAQSITHFDTLLDTAKSDIMDAIGKASIIPISRKYSKK